MNSFEIQFSNVTEFRCLNGLFPVVFTYQKQANCPTSISQEFSFFFSTIVVRFLMPKNGWHFPFIVDFIHSLQIEVFNEITFLYSFPLKAINVWIHLCECWMVKCDQRHLNKTYFGTCCMRFAKIFPFPVYFTINLDKRLLLYKNYANYVTIFGY